MEKKGLTKKQFWMQMTPNIFFLPLGVNWLLEGISLKKPIVWIAAILYLAVVLGLIAYLIVYRKKYPVEDIKMDEEITKSFKDGMKGIAIVFGIITLGLLISFALIALLK